MDAGELAQAASAAMWAGDRASRRLGMKLEEVRPGYARFTLGVTGEMLNASELCHGGVIFSLADTAFAFACNSRGRVALAAAASIEFLAPGRAGDQLTAEATEQARAARSGVYDVRVTRQDGTLVALYRGKAALLEQRWAGS